MTVSFGSRLFLGFGAILSIFVMSGSPMAAEAATKKTKAIAYDLYNPRRTYGDEKKEITNTASRCVTKEMIALHAKNEDRAKKDAEPFKIEKGSDLEDDFELYFRKLDVAWDAMQQPYCGFGAFGMKAARKSYDKTIERARTEFLTVAKRSHLALAKVTR